MPPKLSVVVPTYNVEEWLGECLESIRVQSLTDWETIIVIDGATDGSAGIAHEFAAADARFTVLETPNGGLGAARNRGLDAATGTYIAFVDSDDRVAPTAFAELVAELEASGSDVVTSIGVDFFPDAPSETYWVHRGPLFSQRRSRLALATEPALILDHTTWNKVYRRAFLVEHGIRHPEQTLYEDVQHQARVYATARSVDVLPIESYFHRRRSGAISAINDSPAVVTDWIEQTEAVRSAIAGFGPEVHRAHLGRLIVSEAPLRVRVAVHLGDAALRERLRSFLRRLISEADALGIEHYPTFNYLVTRLFAEGPLVDRWHLARPHLTPIDSWTADWSERLPADAEALLALDYSSTSETKLGWHVLSALLQQGAAAGAWEDPEHAGALGELLRSLPPSFTDDVRADAENWFGIGPFLSAARDGDVERAVGLIARYDPEPIVAGELVTTGVVRDRLVLTGTASVSASLEDPRVRAEVVLRPNGGRARFLRAGLVARDAGAAGPGAGGRSLRWSARVPLAEVRDIIGTSLFLRIYHPEWGRAELRVSVPESARVADPGTGALSARIALDTENDCFDCRVDDAPRGAADGSDADRGDAVAAAGDAADRTRVLVFPYWNSNPFLNILYLAARTENRFEVQGAVLLPDILAGIERLGAGDIAHVQWTRTICQDAESETAARDALQRFTSTVQAARSRGVRLVWTVNNVLAHDARYPEVEVELNRTIAEHADRVHIMAPDTLTVASEFYEIPADRVARIDHPSYLGVYGQRLERPAALRELEADDHDLNVLFFGQIHPYKGVDQLLSAITRIEADDRGRDIGLFLAGRMNPQHAKQVSAMLPKRIATTTRFAFIPDQDVPLWFSAVDLLVLPYRRVLNSGSLHLAATFGVSVLLPDEPHLLSQFAGEAWVHFYDRDRPEASLADFLREWRPSAAERDAADAFARARLPYLISSEVLELLRTTSDAG